MEYQDNESIAYLTATVSQAVADSLSNFFRQSGIELPFSQFLLLIQLYRCDGQTQQELSQTLKKDKAAIKRSVDNLIEKGLVERKPAAGTAKNIPLRLTDKAIVQREQVRDIYRKHFGQVMQDITKEELTVTRDTLRKILRNLKKI